MSLFFRAILMIVCLAGVWFLLSGKADLLHFGTGLAVAIIISLASLPALARGPRFPWLRFFLFVPWHLWQVFVSNLRVARLVLSVPRPRIEPSFLVADSIVRDERGLAVLGMGITLTPGTLTVDIDEECMVIHALDRASAADIKEKTMVNKVASIFGEKSP